MCGTVMSCHVLYWTGLDWTGLDWTLSLSLALSLSLSLSKNNPCFFFLLQTLVPRFCGDDIFSLGSQALFDHGRSITCLAAFFGDLFLTTSQPQDETTLLPHDATTCSQHSGTQSCSLKHTLTFQDLHERPSPDKESIGKPSQEFRFSARISVRVDFREVHRKSTINSKAGLPCVFSCLNFWSRALNPGGRNLAVELPRAQPCGSSKAFVGPPDLGPNA